MVGIETDRVTRSSAANARLTPYELPAVAPGAKRGSAAAAAARQRAQQQQQAQAAAAQANAEALRAEAAALEDAEFEQLLAAAAAKPGPVHYDPPANSSVQAVEALRSDVNTQMAYMANTFAAAMASLKSAPPAPEAPTGLSSVAAAEAVKTFEAMSEQLKGADTGE